MRKVIVLIIIVAVVIVLFAGLSSMQIGPGYNEKTVVRWKSSSFEVSGAYDGEFLPTNHYLMSESWAEVWNIDPAARIQTSTDARKLSFHFAFWSENESTWREAKQSSAEEAWRDIGGKRVWVYQPDMLWPPKVGDLARDTYYLHVWMTGDIYRSDKLEHSGLLIEDYATVTRVKASLISPTPNSNLAKGTSATFIVRLSDIYRHYPSLYQGKWHITLTDPGQYLKFDYTMETKSTGDHSLRSLSLDKTGRWTLRIAPDIVSSPKEYTINVYAPGGGGGGGGRHMYLSILDGDGIWDLWWFWFSITAIIILLVIVIRRH